MRPDDVRDEMKAYGLHACRAIAKNRPDDVVRILLRKDLKSSFSELLAHCAENRRAYRFVLDEELAKVSGSQHHEGVFMIVRRPAVCTLEALLSNDSATTLLYLDGVQNPHNLGAILRSAAHFGVAAVLVQRDQGATLSGAALRVAEGGAEYVPVVELSAGVRDLKRIAAAGFRLFACDMRGATTVEHVRFAPKTIVLLGAEGSGLNRETLSVVHQSIQIPGTGNVESLNVATVAGVVLAYRWAQRPGP